MSRLSLPHAPRPRLLVSVRDEAEADLAAGAGAGLVDAKDPEEGALGMLPDAVIRSIVAAVGGRAAVSAVAGEPRRWRDLLDQARAVAGTGVDLVKVAWPADDGPTPQAFDVALQRLPCPVVVVFFAENAPSRGHVRAAAAAGFAGAMIDTAVKDGGTLLDRMPAPALAEFLRACREHAILSGLAGSLQLSHIARLAALGPGYVGLRGGLCRGGSRRDALDPGRVAAAVRHLGAFQDRAAVA